VVEDGDVSAYEAVRDPSSAVYVVALHDDGVLYLGVPDGGVVSDARVRADECFLFLGEVSISFNSRFVNS